MSNNKQSSVEYLANYIKGISSLNNDEIIEQAKAMHKEEVTTFTANWSVQWKYDNGKSIIQYYNETFGGNNE